MNCFNGEDFVALAIDSVINQSYQNWELIFVDNASDDRTPDILKTFSNDKRIKYYRNSHNKPLGEARNIALEMCSGKYLAFLDSDDLWEKDKLSLQVAILEHKSNVALVYSNFSIINGSSSDSLSIRRPKFWSTKPSGYVFRKFLRQYPINLQTVMLRRSVLSQLKLKFDPSLQLAEEFHIFMRLLLKNEAYYQAKVTAGYRVHANQDSIKKIALYPKENQYIINQFKTTFKDFSSEYKEDIEYFEAKIKYYKVYLRDGETTKALESLKQAGSASLRLRCLYWTLKFSPYVFNAVHKISNRYI